MTGEVGTTDGLDSDGSSMQDDTELVIDPEVAAECKRPHVFCPGGYITIDFVENYWCPDCGKKIDLESAGIFWEVCTLCNPRAVSDMMMMSCSTSKMLIQSAAIPPK